MSVCRLYPPPPGQPGLGHDPANLPQPGGAHPLPLLDSKLAGVPHLSCTDVPPEAGGTQFPDSSFPSATSRKSPNNLDTLNQQVPWGPCSRPSSKVGRALFGGGGGGAEARRKTICTFANWAPSGQPSGREPRQGGNGMESRVVEVAGHTRNLEKGEVARAQLHWAGREAEKEPGCVGVMCGVGRGPGGGHWDLSRCSKGVPSPGVPNPLTLDSNLYPEAPSWAITCPKILLSQQRPSRVSPKPQASLSSPSIRLPCLSPSWGVGLMSPGPPFRSLLPEDSVLTLHTLTPRAQGSSHHPVPSS